MSGLNERDRAILESIIGYCGSIESRLERYDIDEDVFTHNDDYREMVLFPLLQIGESANHFSKGFLDTYDAIPWKDVVGMRHIVVHGYDSLDTSWAWNTVSSDIGALKEYCEGILSLCEAEEGGPSAETD